MKLFQQLLVAPAALGLMAPLAANAADLNINDVSDYSASASEVQSFSDIYPTDWAYQALISLAERHGCAVSNPSGTITRYEAAALLNECLGNISQLNEEERRLVNEFGPELAVIKGRVDGLEARVGEFEAGQFSKTTTMSGDATFIVGSAFNEEDGPATESTTFEYAYGLDLNTSFNGDDLLYTRIDAGNVGDHFVDGSMTLGASESTGDVLTLTELWYTWPLTNEIQVWVGPKIENKTMLASGPSIYGNILDQFGGGGMGPVYGSKLLPGFGAAWTQETENADDGRWEFSASYTAENGTESTDNQGMFGDDAKSALLIKSGYGTPRWQVSLAASVKDTGWEDCMYATNIGCNRHADSSSTNIGLRAYWQPDEAGWVPSVQFGYDQANVDDNPNDWDETYPDEAAGWMFGFGWDDVFIDGNSAGLAFGQRVHATSYPANAEQYDSAADTFSWEAYYTFKVSDNITVTPTLFANSSPNSGVRDDNNGVVVVSEFKF